VLTLDGSPQSRVEIQQQAIEWTRGGAGIKAHARYAMTAAVRTRLKTYYSTTRKLGAFELVNAPPSRAPGVMILAAPPALSAHVGDRVVSIAGTAIGDLIDVPPTGELVVEHVERRSLAVKER
jgi:hypothetical protein